MFERRMYIARSLVLQGALAGALAAGCAHATAGAPRAARLADRSGADDRVSIGYETVARRDVTGGVASVQLDDVQRHGVMHVAELIDGRVPGVEVRKLGAGEYSLRVRGTPSRVANGEPLVVVDGMPIGSGFSRRSALSDVSPGDVERIDVLKGADASVYGVRGANGVILITLKRPGR